nr:putative f-box/lrr-repeat protein [Quercus suber]
MNDGVDRISELPEVTIHHILSFLSAKAVAKTSLLSKRWKSFTFSFPVLDFNEDDFQEKTNKKKDKYTHRPQLLFRPKCPEFPTREEFMHFVNNSLLRFCEQKICIDTFKLQVTLTDMENVALLNKWIELAVEYCVKVLDVCVIMKGKKGYSLPQRVFSAKRINVLKLAGCKLEHHNLKNTTNFCSLKELSLQRVYVDEQMLQNLVSHCPSIEHLTLFLCYGFKKFQALKPLKYFYITPELDLEAVYVEGPSFRYLRFEQFAGKLGEIKVNACQNLRELHLESAGITDQCLHDFNTKFPHLHSLILRFCNKLETVHISSHSLKRFILCLDELNGKLREAEIDTPNLQDFHVGCSGKFPKLSFKSGPCRTRAELYLSSSRHQLNTNWFLELREFLENIRAKTTFLSLHGQVMNAVCTFEELLLTPSYDLQFLRLNLCLPETGYLDFVNGLLLICHPKTLSVLSERDSSKPFVKKLMATTTNMMIDYDNHEPRADPL